MSLPTDPSWLSAAWTTVPFVELGVDEGLEEGWNERGAYAHKPYLVPWDQRLQFARDVRGVSHLSGGRGGNWIRGLPLLYPDSPESQIYATGAVLKSAGGNFIGYNPIRYQYAIMQVTFGPLDWNAQQGDDPNFFNSITTDPAENNSLLFATQELDFSAQWEPIELAKATYLSTGNKVTTPQKRRFNVTHLILTWHRYPLMPMDQIETFADSVNNDTFLGRARGTVFFEGCRTTREKSQDALGNWNVAQKVQMNLKWRKYDWNEFVAPDGSLDTIIFNGDTTKTTYPYKDFSQLLL